ncbi:MAG: hypothetical protein AB7G28_18155 [Pirellulales bacterium]
MLARPLIPIRRFACLAALLGALPGCALWKPEAWDLNRLRDDRAREIDSRLSSDDPIVQNPFQAGTPSH